jgi:hypothetical protein
VIKAMKLTPKERAIRKILAALLESELSVDEIGQLLADIQANPSFAQNVRDLLNRTIGRVRDTGLKKLPNKTTDQRSREDLIFSAIQRHRLSKLEVLNLMRMSTPSEALSLNHTSSMRELVSDFLRQASSHQVEELLKHIDPTREDPYLSGIARRS